ncbi:hypothetical protein BGW41_000619 [Actinomortierella wolfii]|nr:hypothetical protein BGW41_000619 [Actinomortierella wolfii]
MPFVQPRGVQESVVTPSIAKSPAARRAEMEKSCRVRNGWVKSINDENLSIFTKTWQPVGVNVQSVVVFVHDITEHCERYHPFFIYFAAKGIEVQAFDLPGFGETGGRANNLGVTGGYKVLLTEIDHAIARAVSSHPSRPVFLMGHGMGGALVLNYACGLGHQRGALAGIIVSSPYIKPSSNGAGSKFPGTYNQLSKWYPNMRCPFVVLPEELTRDKDEQQRHCDDGLILDAVSLQCLADMIYQGQKILVSRWKHYPINLPALVFHGLDDPICSCKATATVCHQIIQLEPINFRFKSWKCNRHDPHWDNDYQAVRSEYVHWIRSLTRHFTRPPLETEFPCQPHFLAPLNRQNSEVTVSHRSSTSERVIQGIMEVFDPSQPQPPEQQQQQEQSTTTKKKWSLFGRSKHKKVAGRGEAERSVAETLGLPQGQPGNNVGGMAGTSSEHDDLASEDLSIPTTETTRMATVSNSEPEPIQDLAGLIRQREQEQLKREEKRRELGLEEEDKQQNQEQGADTTALSAKIMGPEGTDTLNSQPSLQSETNKTIHDSEGAGVHDVSVDAQATGDSLETEKRADVAEEEHEQQQPEPQSQSTESDQINHIVNESLACNDPPVDSDIPATDSTVVMKQVSQNSHETDDNNASHNPTEEDNVQPPNSEQSSDLSLTSDSIVPGDGESVSSSLTISRNEEVTVEDIESIKHVDLLPKSTTLESDTPESESPISPDVLLNQLMHDITTTLSNPLPDTVDEKGLATPKGSCSEL